MVGQEPLFRVRQKHSRSRTGCLTCRERHVRCDERRPSCLNCLKVSRKCEYAPAGQPLKSQATRTKLPGVESPWQITPQVSVALGDPFDALPIKMSYKSTDVLRFYLQTKQPVADFVIPDLWRRNIAEKNNDSTFCRGVLLCAAAFFAGHAGGLRNFEATYLYHRGEAMKDLNKWLASPVDKYKEECLRLVGTLLLTESYLGNYKEAERHAQGLEALIALRNEPEFAKRLDQTDPETEGIALLLERFNLVSLAIARVKREAEESAASSPTSASSAESPPPFLPVSKEDHADRLESMRLMPYFFTNVSADKAALVDAGPIISELRLFCRVPDFPGAKLSWTHLPGSVGSMSVTILNGTNLHVRSLFGVAPKPLGKDDITSDCLVATLAAIQAARHCFMYCVMGIRKIGTSVATTLMPRLLTLLKDEDGTQSLALMSSQCNPDLWIWMVFVAAIAIERFWTDLVEIHGLTAMQAIRDMGRQHIVLWERTQNAGGWFQIEDALKRIVWLDRFSFRALVVWEAAVVEDGTSGLSLRPAGGIVEVADGNGDVDVDVQGESNGYAVVDCVGDGDVDHSERGVPAKEGVEEMEGA